MRVQDLGFGVWGLGLRVWGLVLGVWVLGFGVWGLSFGVRGLGFGVWGFGFMVWGLESKEDLFRVQRGRFRIHETRNAYLATLNPKNRGGFKTCSGSGAVARSQIHETRNA